jgi:signal transduction histidine kinase
VSWRRVFWPRRLASQIAVCLILTLFVSQFLTALFLVTLEPPSGPPPFFVAADRVALVLAVLDAVPAADRPSVTAALQLPYLRIETGGTSDVNNGSEPSAARPFYRLLEERLGNRFALRVVKSDALGLAERVMVDTRLRDGTTVRIEAALPGSFSIVGIGIGFFFRSYLPSLTIALAILTLWAARRVTAPLRAFSDAAERLGNERSAPPLPEYGPVELQRAARSFNKMQEQVKRFIEDRTRTLAAISHDLRTPITRLRLRVDAAVENVDEQQKMLRDLNQMDAMVSSALSFLRDGARDEPMVLVDLASLLQSACDNFGDMGCDVRYVGMAHLPVRCRAELVTRAVTNLIENATKYGSTGTVDLSRDSSGKAIIHIDDDGAGIPDAEKKKAFEPFYRLDTARGADSGGFGLGLSIARTIVELHGGQIELTNRIPSGTRVVMTLPI